MTDADSALAEYIPMVQRPRGNTGKICIYIYNTMTIQRNVNIQHEHVHFTLIGMRP